MYTEQQLVAFGNFLLKKHHVRTSHPEQRNNPEAYVLQAKVTDQDFNEWGGDEINIPNSWFPSRFNIGEKVIISLKGLSAKNDGSIVTAEFTAIIHAVHFTISKVKYDLDVDIFEESSTRIYNIDSCFVVPLP